MEDFDSYCMKHVQILPLKPNFDEHAIMNSVHADASAPHG